MNEQQWLDWIEENLKKADVHGPLGKYTADIVLATQLSDLISRLPEEKELPVIPQFVADWLRYVKNTDITLYGAMDNEFLNTQELTRWMTDGKNQLKFARAWLYGYEIEIEKLYFVKESTTGQFLVRDIQQSNGVKWVDGFSTKPEYYTEQEIKEINTRYWSFAKEVTQ